MAHRAAEQAPLSSFLKNNQPNEKQPSPSLFDHTIINTDIIYSRKLIKIERKKKKAHNFSDGKCIRSCQYQISFQFILEGEL